MNKTELFKRATLNLQWFGIALTGIGQLPGEQVSEAALIVGALGVGLILLGTLYLGLKRRLQRAPTAGVKGQQSREQMNKSWYFRLFLQEREKNKPTKNPFS